MNAGWYTSLGMRSPVVQAGMGGGLSTSMLASAVSRAGGLGTVGIMAPEAFLAELHRTRTAVGESPFAANLLMPFVRQAHVEACLSERPAVAVLFYGFDASLVRRLKQAGIRVWHQIGSVAQARRALSDGADALIAQGVEAGGHLAGSTPLRDLLVALKPLAGKTPVLAAGGIFDAASACNAQRLGADGVVAGTRFLLSPESDAHPDYQAQLLRANDTVRTLLFGLSWPAYHRVVPNAAVHRWCHRHSDGPRWLTLLNHLSIPARRFISLSQASKMAGHQRLGVPFYTAVAKTTKMTECSTEVTPLYAGNCVAQIDSLRDAAEIVEELSQGFLSGSLSN
ncbi:MAG: nitronate monooxygenase [Nevskiales bacterium]|nr:nitronate monooxygenase [Nevskiales bacterium]